MRIWEDNIEPNPKELRFKDVNWTCLAKNRDKWRAVVIAVMKLRPSGNAEILVLAEGLAASEDSTSWP
jgi:hypothetical protein